MKQFYYLSMSVLSFLAVIFSLCSTFNVISIKVDPWRGIYFSLLIIFWIDYLNQLSQAQNKWQFFKSHIIDLISILPMLPSLYIFKGFRLFRLVPLITPIRLYNFSKKFLSNMRIFLNTNGLNYSLIAAVCLSLGSAILISFCEKISFWDALWFSIVTTTTVGYGDIVPHTLPGRIVSVLLMIFGIGLMSHITSSIITFTKRTKNDDE